jgi:hypothetical protein
MKKVPYVKGDIELGPITGPFGEPGPWPKKRARSGAAPKGKPAVNTTLSAVTKDPKWSGKL